MKIEEEKYNFTPKAKKNIAIAIALGVVLFVIGTIAAQYSMDSHSHSQSDAHQTETHSTDEKTHNASEEAVQSHSDHHETPKWLKRVYSNLWLNGVFFSGLALIGVFFFAIQYAAQVGWSAGVKRIPLSFGAWLPYGFLTLVFIYFVGGHDIFHWTHASLYGESGDEIIKGKSSYFFAPLEGGTFPFFWMARLVVFFLIWYLFFKKLKSLAQQEDTIEIGREKWIKIRNISAIFLVFFAVSSSMAAWDWVMSIDTHWFSTMFGWYVFASWWVAGLALTTFIVILLKEKGYLSVVNENHIHDLGKFVFAFSIFWTYIWFSQFMLIYYAHIPEETVYYFERWRGAYSGFFYFNIIVNFFFPFLMLMTRESKRQTRILKIVCPALVFGHWIDFYLMIMPGTVKYDFGFGLLEVGMLLVFLGAFLYVVLNSMSKFPLYGKYNPMIKESLHHHV